MYDVSIASHFSSAHKLRGYQGKCEALHGHNWKVRVVVSKDKLNKTGLAIDFHNLELSLNKIVKRIDHKYLNEIPEFKKINPSSENIAKYIYDKLIKDKNLKGVNFLRVIVWESEKNYASFYG